MGMQNAEFSMVNFVIKYDIALFKKRLTHACKMTAETFQHKFVFLLDQKDFTIASLQELRNRLMVCTRVLLWFECLMAGLAVFLIRHCMFK